jgi:uncharacterized protein
VQAGADVKARNAEGATPLHDAALGGHAEAAEALLEAGAEIDARDEARGATALWLAASWGRGAVVEMLLERQASRLIRDKTGKTPREAAMENGHAALAALL